MKICCRTRKNEGKGMDGMEQGRDAAGQGEDTAGQGQGNDVVGQRCCRIRKICFAMGKIH